MTTNQSDSDQVRYEAELKVVTLLFVDLVDSLRSISSLNPEEVAEFMELITSRVTEIAHQHRGIVASIAGDGVLFLFGAPIANSKHAFNACISALKIRDSIQSMSNTGEMGSLRIGLSSGEVLVRPIKTDIGWQYDPTGLAVHMGSRMEALAAPGMICATRSVYDLTRDSFLFSQLEPQNVKGLEDDISVFSLDGERSPESSLKIIYQTEFFDRVEEMQRLKQICHDQTSQGSKITVLLGDAGVGKSRLLFEIQKDLKLLNDFRVVYYKGHYGFSDPFTIIRECLYQFVGISQESDLDTFIHAALPEQIDSAERDQLKSTLTNLYDGLRRASPTHRNSESGKPATPYNKLKSNIREGFQALLNANKDGARPIFFLDEFLEYDEGSREVFINVMSSYKLYSVIFILSMRSERLSQNFVSQFNELQMLKINCLPEQSSLAIVSEMIDEPLAAHVDIHELVRKSGGNPLFIEELVKSCRSTIDLNGGEKNTDYIASNKYITPNSAVLTALISERVDRLPHEAKEILRVASILGEEFNSLLLHKILDQCEIKSEQVATLFFETFLLKDDESNIEQLRFVHPLVREVVHSSILRKDRLRIHRAAFEVLESNSHARGHAEALAMAHHANEALLWDDAVVWFWRAGVLSNERAMNSQAIALYTSAITASKNLESTLQRACLEIDLLVEMRNPLYQIGDLSGVMDRLSKAKTMAQTADESRRLGKILLCESHVNWLRGNPKEGLAQATDAHLIADANDDRAMRVRSNFHAALASFSMGDCRQAANLLDGVTETIASGVASKFLGVNQALAATAESYRARSLLELGEHNDSIEAAANAVALAEHSNDLFARIIADISSGIVLLGGGLIDRSREFFTKANESVNAVEAKLMRPVCEANIGFMLITTGKLEDGCQYIESSIRDSAKIGLNFQSGTRHNFLSIARMLESDFRAAHESASNAVEQAKASGEDRTAKCAVELCKFFEKAPEPDSAEVLRLFSKLSVEFPQFAGSLNHLSKVVLGR